MLLEFGAENFCSFKEGFEISFQKSKNSTENITNIIAVKGANASGKTNILKALSFLHDFILNSFSNLKPDEDINMSSFFKNKERTLLYIIFLEKNIEYKYEIQLTNKKIISEKIWKKDKRETLVVERDDALITTTKEFKELEIINLNRKNASIVSLAKQYGLNELDMIYNFFNNMFSNVDIIGHNKNLFDDFNGISKLYFDDSNMLSFIIKFLKKSDIGLHDIKILSKKDEETGLLTYFPIFEYKVNDIITTLNYYEQSAGTQLLFTQLSLYKLVIHLGSLLVLDEFDISLHPDLLPMLLELFEDKESNPKNAQLILTTHNYDIMDRLGKYKTVLVNKVDNESFLYRLDEIPGDIIRNDRPISPIYNANKIGGKPKIKA